MAIFKLGQLNHEHLMYPLCVQYTKPWLHSNIRSSCCRSLHVCTFRYDYTLFGCIFFTPKAYLHDVYRERVSNVPYALYKNTAL